MFMLFVYEEYEERGGWNDFVGIFGSVSEAKIHELESRRDQPYTRHNGQIVETATIKVVSSLDTYKTGQTWRDWEHRWKDS